LTQVGFKPTSMWITLTTIFNNFNNNNNIVKLFWNVYPNTHFKNSCVFDIVEGGTVRNCRHMLYIIFILSYWVFFSFYVDLQSVIVYLLIIRFTIIKISLMGDNMYKQKYVQTKITHWSHNDNNNNIYIIYPSLASLVRVSYILDNSNIIIIYKHT